MITSRSVLFRFVPSDPQNPSSRLYVLVRPCPRTCGKTRVKIPDFEAKFKSDAALNNNPVKQAFTLLYHKNPVFDLLDDILLFILGAVRVDVHGGLDVLVSHDRLDHLEVCFVFAKPRAEGMS